ncbi:hypothetical protein [Streptomyces sp. NPDC005476]|uniref:hypothetical protein n=1 Tax=Streptomyces sp. NPDC005476 TaxID=3156882 RepID=UPI0034513100
MSTRTFRGSRTVATMIPIATAVLVGGLLTATPASAVDTGEVTYKGTVNCGDAFPTAKSVARHVTLSSSEDSADGATTLKPNKRPTYGPLTLEVPLDTSFKLTVTVECKAPKVKAKEFTQKIQQNDLTEDEAVTLNITVK